MGCGCGGSSEMVYIFTPPTGPPQTFSKEIQAKVAKIKAGGGTVTSKPK